MQKKKKKLKHCINSIPFPRSLDLTQVGIIAVRKYRANYSESSSTKLNYLQTFTQYHFLIYFSEKKSLQRLYFYRPKSWILKVESFLRIRPGSSFFYTVNINCKLKYTIVLRYIIEVIMYFKQSELPMTSSFALHLATENLPCSKEISELEGCEKHLRMMECKLSLTKIICYVIDMPKQIGAPCAVWQLWKDKCVPFSQLSFLKAKHSQFLQFVQGIVSST